MHRHAHHARLPAPPPLPSHLPAARLPALTSSSRQRAAGAAPTLSISAPRRQPEALLRAHRCGDTHNGALARAATFTSDRLSGRAPTGEISAVGRGRVVRTAAILERHPEQIPMFELLRGGPWGPPAELDPWLPPGAYQVPTLNAAKLSDRHARLRMLPLRARLYPIRIVAGGSHDAHVGHPLSD